MGQGEPHLGPSPAVTLDSSLPHSTYSIPLQVLWALLANHISNLITFQNLTTSTWAKLPLCLTWNSDAAFGVVPATSLTQPVSTHAANRMTFFFLI